jgi:hypothetical protein
VALPPNVKESVVAVRNSSGEPGVSAFRVSEARAWAAWLRLRAGRLVLAGCREDGEFAEAIQMARERSEVGDFQGALSLLESCLDQDPENPEVLDCLGQILDERDSRRDSVVSPAPKPAESLGPAAFAGSSEEPPGGLWGFILALFGTPVDQKLKDGLLHLNVDSDFEMGFIFLGAGCFGLGLFMKYSAMEPDWLAWVLLGSLPLILMVAWTIDDHYVMDASRKALFFHRKFLGRVDLRQEATFAEMAAVTTTAWRTKTRHGSRLGYAALLVLKDTRVIEVSPSLEDDLQGATKVARLVAWYAGIRQIPGEVFGRAVVSRDQASGEVRVKFTSV